MFIFFNVVFFYTEISDVLFFYGELKYCEGNLHLTTLIFQKIIKQKTWLSSFTNRNFFFIWICNHFSLFFVFFFILRVKFSRKSFHCYERIEKNFFMNLIIIINTIVATILTEYLTGFCNIRTSNTREMLMLKEWRVMRKLKGVLQF